MTELEDRWRDLGEFIRDQRRIGQLSLRKLSEMAGISNPYLSQIERGLRKPSAEILRQIAQALHISAESLYVRAGILEERDGVIDLVAEIRRDPVLNDEQKKTLVLIYESFRAEQQAVIDAQLAALDLSDEAIAAIDAAGDEGAGGTLEDAESSGAQAPDGPATAAPATGEAGIDAPVTEDPGSDGVDAATATAISPTSPGTHAAVAHPPPEPEGEPTGTPTASPVRSTAGDQRPGGGNGTAPDPADELVGDPVTGASGARALSTALGATAPVLAETAMAAGSGPSDADPATSPAGDGAPPGDGDGDGAR